MKLANAILGTTDRTRGELAFLPAALEIVESPPSPIGRAVGLSIVGFCLAALAWATFGRVDVIATATGKVVPTGRSKVIQPFETGVVQSIAVRDGQRVHQGDVLVVLDTSINEAERNRVTQDLVAIELQVAQLRAALTEVGDPLAAFAPPANAPPARVEDQRRLLARQVEEHRARLGTLDRQLAQAEGNRAAISATIDKLVGSIPLIQQRVDAFQHLAKVGAGSLLNLVQNQQDLSEHQQELKVQAARLAEAEAGIAALTHQRQQVDAEYHRNNLSALTDAEQKAASLRFQLVQADQRLQLKTLTAPVDGTVQQRTVHTLGGVVTPAQPLMVIVPSEDGLEIEATVLNRDIGFVHPGDPVEVKVDTFNYTRYGLLHGVVLAISQDAVLTNVPTDTAGKTAGDITTSEPKGQALQYTARISLDRSQMQVDDRLVDLTPGMAITADIKTGSRRIIEYVLSPLLRLQQESLRDR